MLSDDGNYAGEKLAEVLLQYMDRLKVPLGLTKIGFRESDIEALVEGALPQERVTKLSPNPVHREELTGIFRDAMCY